MAKDALSGRISEAIILHIRTIVSDGIDFETMLAESRKYGIHYIFATQTTQQMRDEDRRIFNDRIADRAWPRLKSWND